MTFTPKTPDYERNRDITSTTTAKRGEAAVCSAKFYSRSGSKLVGLA
jgi:hypothetical protein